MRSKDTWTVELTLLVPTNACWYQTWCHECKTYAAHNVGQRIKPPFTPIPVASSFDHVGVDLIKVTNMLWLYNIMPNIWILYWAWAKVSSLDLWSLSCHVIRLCNIHTCIQYNRVLQLHNTTKLLSNLSLSYHYKGSVPVLFPCKVFDKACKFHIIHVWHPLTLTVSIVMLLCTTWKFML